MGERFEVVNLRRLINTMREDQIKLILSGFSCPLNKDVEEFLRIKAIEFAKQGLAQTHLVYFVEGSKRRLVGYFALANKYMTVQANKLSRTLKKRIHKFSVLDAQENAYSFAAPLIGQLGKNFADGNNQYITGDELLKLACDKVRWAQMEIGGKIVYLECEDKPKLISFYRRNGFRDFDRRKLDKDETNVAGEYLVQMIGYL